MPTWTRGRVRKGKRARLSAALAGALLLHSVPVSAGALERAMLGKSTVVDLSHALPAPPTGTAPSHDMSGDAEWHAGGDARAARSLGTRLNAQGRAGKEQRGVAQIPPRELLVAAVVVNVVPKVVQSPDYRVTVDDLKAWERKHGRIPRKSAVLLQTGWSRRWGDPARYVNEDAQGVPRVPGFSPAAVAFLVAERQVRGVGVDAFVPPAHASSTGDPMPRRTPPGVWQLENLANLDRLPARGVKLVVAPVRVEALTAPVRVIAILP